MGIVIGCESVPDVIAHRGASARWPEHTVDAYDGALALGAAVLEVDVRPLADGTPVVVHDPTLLRTAGDGRRVRELLPADIAALPVHGRPLLLEQVLERYGHEARLLIDLKDPATALEGSILGEVAARGLGGRVQLQSFSARALGRARREDPSSSVAQLLWPGTSPRAIAARLPRIASYADAIGPEAGSVDGLVVAAARHHGVRVQPYTVNDADEIHRLLDLGVDGVITDVPDVAAAAIAARSVRPVAALA